uniref:Uncharacterized protein n=1 Tax=Oryzias sinensis TaxID=183150 RepID=A0A8C7XA62_9TELE
IDHVNWPLSRCSATKRQVLLDTQRPERVDQISPQSVPASTRSTVIGDQSSGKSFVLEALSSGSNYVHTNPKLNTNRQTQVPNLYYVDTNVLRTIFSP